MATFFVGDPTRPHVKHFLRQTFTLNGNLVGVRIVPQASYAEYLQVELETGIRYEFLDGRIFAMGGGSPNHAILGPQFASIVNAALGRGPCQAIGTDLKLRIEDQNLSLYPDVSVHCGELQISPEDKYAATAPTLVAEVLSPTTESYDRGEKFDFYKQIPSLQEYVLISTSRKKVEVYQRQPEGRWLVSDLGPGSTVVLPSLEVSFSLDDLYERVTLDDSGRRLRTREDRQPT